MISEFYWLRKASNKIFIIKMCSDVLNTTVNGLIGVERTMIVGTRGTGSSNPFLSDA